MRSQPVYGFGTATRAQALKSSIPPPGIESPWPAYTIVPAIAGVDVRTAECRNAEDQAAILSELEAIGASECNGSWSTKGSLLALHWWVRLVPPLLCSAGDSTNFARYMHDGRGSSAPASSHARAADLLSGPPPTAESLGMETYDAQTARRFERGAD